MAENRNLSKESNENSKQQNSPDQENEKRKGNKQKNKGRKGSSSTAIRENTKTEGGTSQRNDDLNIGPMDAEFDELPSKSRASGSNQTGPGLG